MVKHKKAKSKVTARNKYLYLGVFIVVIIAAVAALLIWGKGASSGQAVSSPPVYLSCGDTDNGDNPYIPGIVYTTYNLSGVIKQLDSYIDTYSGGYLYERKCSNVSFPSTTSPYAFSKVSCANGSAYTSVKTPLTGVNRSYIYYCKCTTNTQCGVGYSCSADGKCVKESTPVCIPSIVANGTVGAYPGCVVTCNTGYTLSNGACAAASSVNNTNTTNVTCTPQCVGKTCGFDGCGGSCGTCTTGQTCSYNNCVTDCGAKAAYCDGDLLTYANKDCGQTNCANQIDSTSKKNLSCMVVYSYPLGNISGCYSRCVVGEKITTCSPYGNSTKLVRYSCYSDGHGWNYNNEWIGSCPYGTTCQNKDSNGYGVCK